ncbi:MAG: hypothetical protein BWY06_03310 [Candidatus Latescibacteria bacterium ADurb.Bin168]|nr:MAG: hypothetical protein BWY06_03310 [Candidatus Latescibacteria bacterium ADurb.Bin168]
MYVKRRSWPSRLKEIPKTPATAFRNALGSSVNAEVANPVIPVAVLAITHS